MKKPRDLYFEYYENSHDKLTFQQRSMTFKNVQMLASLYSESPDKYNTNTYNALNFKGNFSNDIRFETLFISFFNRLNCVFAEKMNKLFIAHTYDNEFKAFIRNHRGKTDGEIIFLDMGLTGEIIWYTVGLSFLYHAINSYPNANWIVSNLDKFFELSKIKCDIKNSNEKLRWTTDQNKLYMSMTPSIRDTAAHFSNTAFGFLMAHEISHYLLGHLNGEDYYHEYIKFAFADVMASNFEHQKELNADLFAILLMSNSLNTFPLFPPMMHPSFLSAIGSQLLFTILALHTNPLIDTETHPKPMHRYNLCLNFLERGMNYSEFTGALVLIKSFQKLLHRNTGHGLGVTIGDDYYLTPWE